MILPAGQAGWVSPGIMHKAKMIGRVSAVFIYFDASLSNALPKHVFAFTPTTLILEIIARFATHTKRKQWLKSDNNLMQVLLDELNTPSVMPLSLLMPKEKNLAFVAKQFIIHPGVKESIEYWAKEAHMSKRTFTRQFRSETEMSFAKWCQANLPN